MNIKKNVYIILLSVLLLSCVKANLGLTINEDLSGQVSFDMVFSQDGKKLINNYLNQNNQNNISNLPISSDDMEDIMSSGTFSKKINFKSLDDFGPNSIIKHTVKEDGVNVVKIEIANENLFVNNVEFSSLYLTMAQVYMPDTYLELKIKTPKKILSNTLGKLLSDNELYYKVNILELLIKPSSIEFSF